MIGWVVGNGEGGKGRCELWDPTVVLTETQGKTYGMPLLSLEYYRVL